MFNYDIEAGFSRVVINPPMGIDVNGYFITRKADGILDDLEINTLAVKKDDKTVLLMTFDTESMRKEFVREFTSVITAEMGIPAEAIFVHSTHTHTGGRLGFNDFWSEEEKAYRAQCRDAAVEGARLALADLKKAKMGYAVSEAKNVAFNRRYLMKDGTTKTNPGVNNPDIVKCIGLLDERVNVLRFTREDGTSLVLANFGNHPDTIGGTKISADWPGFTRRIFEKAIDGTKCIFFNGAQGDVNHVNVFPKGGDLNDMFMDFDDVSRGYGHARHLGNVMAGAIMQVFDKVCYTDVDKIDYLQSWVPVPLNKAKEEDMPEYRRIVELHNAGRDSELPYEGMMLTTVVAEALMKLKAEKYPDELPLLLSGIRIGGAAFVGIPGEPFTGVGMGIKAAEGWDMILPCCNTNDKEGYFPMKDSFDEGGYEARSSIFRGGVAEALIDGGVKLLDDMRAK